MEDFNTNNNINNKNYNNTSNQDNNIYNNNNVFSPDILNDERFIFGNFFGMVPEKYIKFLTFLQCI
jgi:hypothetical protein